MAIRAIVPKFRIKFRLLYIKPPTCLRRVRTEENIAVVSHMIINYLLLNNVENFSEGFRCEAFQNTTGARIEAERPTATQNFWWMGTWKVGRRCTSISKNCVQQRSSFLAQWQPWALQKLPMHQEKVTVWFSLWASGIMGSYFFKDAANRNVTVCYREIIFNFFAQNTRAWLAWHVVSTRRWHMPHSTRKNRLIERRLR